MSDFMKWKGEKEAEVFTPGAGGPDCWGSGHLAKRQHEGLGQSGMTSHST